MEKYESLRRRITHFDEMKPEDKKEIFQQVWELRRHVEYNQDGFPKPGAALLHDALTHAALFFIEVYDQERNQTQRFTVEPWGEPILDNENLVSLEDYRDRIKAS